MEKSSGKLLHFLRRNAVYIILALCIIAVGLSLTLALKDGKKTIENDNKEVIDPIDDNNKEVVDPIDDGNNETPVDNTTTYVLPVESSSGITEYSTQMVFNSTLNRYSAHLAVDFFAEEGTDVLAIADGKVESIKSSLIFGTTIVIDHGNGLKSCYNSLQDGESVVVGQEVKRGDVIGKVSVSNRQEYKEGAHLHFTMTENDNVIDPAKYLTYSENNK